ncbi:hypothetical protein ACSSNL_07385 [Thalassobius sp. S69A]|uniref:hypothetical protein n=1 Tax=unclassified Thalassovita TaxID=2619711 RepID=UPI000C0D6B3B|nr:hypothetical protein [Paracoccaceae bacterium]MBT25798.1 hypothetical protein [Paracoccaceae bacterium]
MRLVPGLPLILTMLVAGCVEPDLGPDAAELANIRKSNIVPKSSASAFVKTFDKFCVTGPAAPAAKEALLRDAGYVPLRAPINGARAFVSDDRRPAVAFSDRSCMVYARSRTGQTNRVNRYMRATFPQAVALDPATAGRSFEQVWQVSDSPAALVGSSRHNDGGNRTRFALSYFRPGSRP